jgi:L-aspartate oxidase
VSPAVLRHLPAAAPQWELDADVVVAGSGAAGISAALAAAAHGRRVLLLSKSGLGGGATPLAQGGMAAAIGPGDDRSLHRRDTVEAGAGLCDPAVVAGLVAAAPGEIARLTALGARLECSDLRLEGGHSRHRIVHAGGDATGAEVHRVLTAALLASPVEVLTGVVVLDLLTGGNGQAGGLVAGMAAAGGGPLRAGIITARAVVIATGGFGQAFAATTSPAGVTGDGLALAARAGAELADLEFVQFHPTVLWVPGAQGQRPLITEALRGAGAVLVDAAGGPVMAGRHPLGDLAPRDVVSAAMHERIAAGGGPAGHLWLDATALGRAVLTGGFPTVTAACRAGGIDPVTDPIPVAPGAHYTCGGIRAGLDGRTSVPGLFAAGEAAATGVHGANRLASNSVTESLIAGRRTGDLLGRHLPGRVGGLRTPPPGPGSAAATRAQLAGAMSRHAGVSRDAGGLEQLLGRLAAAPPAPGPGLDLDTVEATSLHTVSVLVATAALARTESRGCHRRSDAPGTAPGPARRSLLRWRDGRLAPAPAAAGPGTPAAVDDQGIAARLTTPIP